MYLVGIYFEVSRCVARPKPRPGPRRLPGIHLSIARIYSPRLAGTFVRLDRSPPFCFYFYFYKVKW